MTGVWMTSVMFHALHRALPTEPGRGFNASTNDGLKGISS